jgi:hypothetical protein
VEDKGRFLDVIADTAWAIAEESSWTVPAHQGAQKAPGGLPDTLEPIVDLFSAQTAHSFAWTWYLLGDRLDKVSPLVRPRLTAEIQRRVLAPYLERDDFWCKGFTPRASRPNNWNPWINSNVLAAALLVEPDDARRAQLVQKVLRSLDTFLGPHPEDGSCDEGPAYWGRAGASLFESLELLQSASAGRIDYFASPVVANIGRFVYRARIADNWFVDSATAALGEHRPRRCSVREDRRPAPARDGRGGVSENRSIDDRSIGRPVRRVRGPCPLSAAPLLCLAMSGCPRGHAVDGRTRPGRPPDGLAVAAWGSHNAQSHNHNDVGNAIVTWTARRARGRGAAYTANIQQQATRSHVQSPSTTCRPSPPDGEGRLAFRADVV